MITAQSVNHRDLATQMPGDSSLEAKKRRVERAVHDEQLTMQVFLALVLIHLPPGKVLMSLDRTTWEHGEAPLNLLVLGAVMHSDTIPLVWIALDHTGNSDTRARLWLVLKLLQALPATRWKGLVADREFIGAEWFRFLRRQGIRRAVRIRKDTILDELRADEWFDDLPPGEFRMIAEKTAVFGAWMRVVATRSPAGDLVIIATDFGVWETWQLYKLRWSLECTFGSLKSRGFDLERTGVTQPKRLERLFGLVTLAWLSCLRIGVWRHERHPIRVLAHGRKAMSLVRYGTEWFINALRWDPDGFAKRLTILIKPFSAPGAA
ncbi:transposase [Deinococcus alpinitundrae]|uniref:transposase n=1 Tax=Deinococcus alpinitundrae TaxID=468913 RepID=UPI00137B40D1|nr:transposase [Deinococcus alpinitundrae]